MKTLAALIMLVTAATAFSQGQLSFSTKTSGVDAPVSYDGSGPVPIGTLAGYTNTDIKIFNQVFGPYARAGLYGGPDGSAEDQLVLLTPSVPFRNDGTFRGYVDTRSAQGGVPRTVQGVPAGQYGVFQIRAWDTGLPQTSTSSYEDAIDLIGGLVIGIYEGKSGLVRVGPLTTAPTTPPTLVGVTAFTMTFVHDIPEPSTMGLGILGGLVGLLLLRRRK